MHLNIEPLSKGKGQHIGDENIHEGSDFSMETPPTQLMTAILRPFFKVGVHTWCATGCQWCSGRQGMGTMRDWRAPGYYALQAAHRGGAGMPVGLCHPGGWARMACTVAHLLSFPGKGFPEAETSRSVITGSKFQAFAACFGFCSSKNTQPPTNLQ